LQNTDFERLVFVIVKLLILVVGCQLSVVGDIVVHLTINF